MRYLRLVAAWMFGMSCLTAQAQGLKDYKEGDRVEAQDCAHSCLWRTGTVKMIYGLLSVEFDSLTLPDGRVVDASFSSVRLNDPARVRKLGAASGPALSIGDRVDDKGVRPSHARGVVIEARAPSYRVRYDGCGDTFNAWRDRAELATAAVIANDHPDIRGLIGKWDMFVAGAPTTVRKGNDLYREYSTGAKAPPLEIRADGSYRWTEQFDRPPVIGRWTASARIADAKIGAEAHDGMIVNDRAGNGWKVYRVSANQMEMRLLCSGQTQMGSRLD